jgi:hypothetical protein
MLGVSKGVVEKALQGNGKEKHPFVLQGSKCPLNCL